MTEDDYKREIARLTNERDRIAALYDSEDKRLDKVVGEKEAEIARLRAALTEISTLKAEDMYQADPNDNTAAKLAREALNAVN